APDVAVLLNVSADHLDRYRDFDAYAEAKSNVFGAQHQGAHAVIPAGDSLSARLAARSSGKVHFFGGAEGEVRMDGDRLRDFVSGATLRRSEFPLAGRHNE